MTPDLLKPLRDAIDGLTYPSESDAPFKILDGPVMALPKGKITELTADQFFDPLKTVTDAPRFQMLHQALVQLFPKPMRVFRIEDGTAVVQILIVGQIRTGRFCGVRTTSVET